MYKFYAHAVERLKKKKLRAYFLQKLEEEICIFGCRTISTAVFTKAHSVRSCMLKITGAKLQHVLAHGEIFAKPFLIFFFDFSCSLRTLCPGAMSVSQYLCSGEKIEKRKHTETSLTIDYIYSLDCKGFVLEREKSAI